MLVHAEVHLFFSCVFLTMISKRQVICWIENHFKKIDNYIEH